MSMPSSRLDVATTQRNCTNGALPEQSKEHPAAKKKTDVLLDLIRDGRPMTLRQQLRLTVELSVPAIIAQLSSIIMQYIDAAMVGRIGAEASASIGWYRPLHGFSGDSVRLPLPDSLYRWPTKSEQAT